MCGWHALTNIFDPVSPNTWYYIVLSEPKWLLSSKSWVMAAFFMQELVQGLYSGTKQECIRMVSQSKSV